MRAVFRFTATLSSMMTVLTSWPTRPAPYPPPAHTSAAQANKYSLAFQHNNALPWTAYQDLGPVQFYKERGTSAKLDDRSG